MGLRINNNIQSVNGHRNLQRNDAMAGRSMEKLSSGLRINKAADDAAGLIISEQMRAQIAGLGQAISNSETAVNMVQTAEGALDEMNTLMKKARTLALHAANEGSNDQSQLVADQSELDNIIGSVTRIAEQTQFGNKKILDGSLNSFRSNNAAIGGAQMGNHYMTNITTKDITRGYHGLEVTQTASQGDLTISGGNTGIMSGGSLSSMSGTDQFLKTFTASFNGAQITIASGSTKNNLWNTLINLGKQAGFTLQASTGDIILRNKNYGATSQLSYSFIAGATGATDITGAYVAGNDLTATLYLNTGAAGTFALSGTTVTVDLAQSGNDLNLVAASGYRINMNSLLVTGWYAGAIDGSSAGATFQIGANIGQKVTIDLQSMRAADIGNNASGTYASLAALNGSLISGNADEALKVIDKAIADVTAQRGKLGAFQSNTLESGLNSLRSSKENLTGAESTIRDVDFAEESAAFTKYQILVQASTAMLAQANQLPQNVLKLLG